MKPSNDCYISFRGQVASLTDREIVRDYELISIGPGPDRALSTALILSRSGAWDITYEISTGRIVDIADAAMPDITQLVPVGTEASHAV